MLKRFISYYKPHRKLFFLDMSAGIVIAACGLFYPTIVKNIINDYVPNGKFTLLAIWSAILLGIYLLKAVCNYIVGYWGHIVGVRMQGDMRRDLFKKYESLPFSYFDDHKTGDLLSRLVGDLFDVSELAHHGPENLLISILMLIGSFIILANIYLPLALIMYAVIPFIVLFTALSRKKMMTAMRNSRRQIATVNAAVENSIAGIRETKSYVAEAHELAKFDEENKRFIGYRADAMHALGTFDAVMTLMTDILYLVIIFVGGLFLYRGYIDTGEFAAFILYISMFLDPIRRFVALFEQMQEGMSGFVRFAEIMALPDETDNGTVTLSDVRGELVFSDVSFRYGAEADEATRPVISHLNLSIPAGETLALVGPSGGGKTTLCHLIPRFYNVTSGVITLDGIPLPDIRLSSLRENIGIVSQNIFLFDGTVRDNITYGAPDATEDEIVAAAKKANIHDYIVSLPKGYDTEVGERGIKLSGGQKQRVAIARVFLKNPKLLILDEATSALDNATEMQIQSALEELARGRTVIVVAHRLSTVKNAHEIVVIDSRGIVERGTHDALMAKNGEYKKLYSYQFRETAAVSDV